MQFDCPFGSAKLRPVKQGDRGIDDRGVKTKQFVLESELFLPLNLALASGEQLQKESLVERLRAVLIGISESGTTGGCNPQMFQLSLAASESSGNLSERMGSDGSKPPIS